MRLLRHLWARPRLERFVDAELPVDLAARVQDHVHECPDCHVEVAELLGLKAALRERVGLGADDAAISRLQQWAEVELPVADR